MRLWWNSPASTSSDAGTPYHDTATTSLSGAAVRMASCGGQL